MNYSRAKNCFANITGYKKTKGFPQLKSSLLQLRSIILASFIAWKYKRSSHIFVLHCRIRSIYFCQRIEVTLQENYAKARVSRSFGCVWYSRHGCWPFRRVIITVQCHLVIPRRRLHPRTQIPKKMIKTNLSLLLGTFRYHLFTRRQIEIFRKSLVDSLAMWFGQSLTPTYAFYRWLS